MGFKGELEYSPSLTARHTFSLVFVPTNGFTALQKACASCGNGKTTQDSSRRGKRLHSSRHELHDDGIGPAVPRPDVDDDGQLVSRVAGWQSVSQSMKMASARV